MSNKKIKNTKIKYYDNILFKSLLEVNCYKLLKESGFNFKYESEKIILWSGFKPTSINIYISNKRKNNLYNNKTKLINITYTPDFIVNINNYKIYIDTKGKENDTYPIKKKMFLKILEERKDGLKYIFFEPRNKKQIQEMIEIINNEYK